MGFQQTIIDSLKDAVLKITDQKLIPQLEHPGESTHGDYSSNVALQSSKFIKESNPREIAEKLKELLEKDVKLQDIVSKIEIAGPGFINFYLSESALSKELELALKEAERYGSSKIGSSDTVVIDYSAPNIAKRFGIGHLRSTVIGQSIYNLYRFIGWNVIGDNHLGDWGTQFGVLLYQVATKNIDPKDLNIDLLEKLYVEFHASLKENELLIDEARKWFKKLEDGDKQAKELWSVMKDISLVEFNRIYKLLGVEIDYAYGESFYDDKMDAVIAECAEKGFSKKSEGALIFEFPNEILPPALLVKSDEATTYFTRDLATVKYRIDTWSPKLIVYEVGDEQSLHFKQVFKAVELLGWANKEQFVHVNHGLYLSPDGKKMRTRTGETVRLEEVLDEAIKRAKVIAIRQLAEKQSLPVSGGSEITTSSRELSGSLRDDIAVSVGIGAIKYFDLSHHHQSNIIFDWDKVFQLDGNSAPYIQYTYARCQSILQKHEAPARRCYASSVAGGRRTKNEAVSNFEFRDLDLSGEELAVLRLFYRFPEVVLESARNFSPNLMCNFLFDLAQAYNSFYNKHRIVDAPETERQFRLVMTKVVGNILKSGLELLGIESPERM